jgi:hypothetical protein
MCCKLNYSLCTMILTGRPRTAFRWDQVFAPPSQQTVKFFVPRNYIESLLSDALNLWCEAHVVIGSGSLRCDNRRCIDRS